MKHLQIAEFSAEFRFGFVSFFCWEGEEWTCGRLAQENYSILKKFQMNRWCGIDFNLEIVMAREDNVTPCDVLFDWIVDLFILATS